MHKKSQWSDLADTNSNVLGQQTGSGSEPGPPRGQPAWGGGSDRINPTINNCRSSAPAKPGRTLRSIRSLSLPALYLLTHHSCRWPHLLFLTATCSTFLCKAGKRCNQSSVSRESVFICHSRIQFGSATRQKWSATVRRVSQPMTLLSGSTNAEPGAIATGIQAGIHSHWSPHPPAEFPAATPRHRDLNTVPA